MAFTLVQPTSLIRTTQLGSWKLKKQSSLLVVRAKIRGDDDDPLLKAAINRASLRYQETTFTPEPLFLDPYAACFLAGMDMKQRSTLSTSHYCLATKFIDDKLLSVVNHMDGVRQIVLLTDGMETRPYRLKWPNSSIIFDIAPERISINAAKKLQGVGAKIRKSCVLINVPSEACDIPEILCRKGFNGNRPSIWALQGLPLMTLASFVDVLVTVSSLAMKGCFFIGELPAWLAETEVIAKPDSQKWIEKLFRSNGFRVDVISYNKIAKDVGRAPTSGDCRDILFVAEQLRLSDIQMETWRREFQRIEEEGDEEGFEEL